MTYIDNEGLFQERQASRRRSLWPMNIGARTVYSSPEKKPRFVITLSDEKFAKLTDRREHLTEILRTGNGDVEVIIQRQGE